MRYTTQIRRASATRTSPAGHTTPSAVNGTLSCVRTNILKPQKSPRWRSHTLKSWWEVINLCFAGQYLKRTRTGLEPETTARSWLWFLQVFGNRFLRRLLGTSRPPFCTFPESKIRHWGCPYCMRADSAGSRLAWETSCRLYPEARRNPSKVL